MDPTIALRLGVALALGLIIGVERGWEARSAGEGMRWEDWEENCDRERTNGDVALRSGDWYRRRLRPHFISAGGGLFVSRRSPIVLWELEKLG